VKIGPNEGSWSHTPLNAKARGEKTHGLSADLDAKIPTQHTTKKDWTHWGENLPEKEKNKLNLGAAGDGKSETFR